jgi:hypothetical protein
MVGALRGAVSLPVSCKMRLFPSTEETVRRALELEAAGCQLLTVHARTRAQGATGAAQEGVANWEAIKAVKAAVSIPVGRYPLHPTWPCFGSWCGSDGVVSARLDRCSGQRRDGVG